MAMGVDLHGRGLHGRLASGCATMLLSALAAAVGEAPVLVLRPLLHERAGEACLLQLLLAFASL
eukprot:scaffold992_cov387-Prasinococcus_capsulatus_cf.AAC.10